METKNFVEAAFAVVGGVKSSKAVVLTINGVESSVEDLHKALNALHSDAPKRQCLYCTVHVPYTSAKMVILITSDGKIVEYNYHYSYKDSSIYTGSNYSTGSYEAMVEILADIWSVSALLGKNKELLPDAPDYLDEEFYEDEECAMQLALEIGKEDFEYLHNEILKNATR